MLNPSTADATVDDPTVRKCVGFAQRYDFAGLSIVNLFALRATNPSAIAKAADPVGPRNDDIIKLVTSGLFEPHVIVAWGSHAAPHPDRVRRVLAIIGRPVLCLGLTKYGHPSHPLMLSYDRSPQPWSMAQIARAS